MSAAAQIPLSQAGIPLKGEDVVKLLMEASARTGTDALLPISFADREIIGLRLDNLAVVPPVNFSGATFRGDTSFKNTLFQGLVEFDSAIFDNSTPFERLRARRVANFDRARFLSGATFIGTEFRYRASFAYATFRGLAYFWHCHFRNAVTFSHIDVEATPESRHAKHEHRHCGEANFSYCLFHGPVDFSRAHFHGNTYFHRTAFLGSSVKFESARFDGEAVFEGNQTDVCIAKADLDDPMRTRLVEIRTLGENDDNEGFLNFQIPFSYLADVENHLDSIPEFSLEQRAEALRVWNEYSRPMFAEKQNVNFHGLLLASHSGEPQCVFRSVSLRTAEFKGTNLYRVKFFNVAWPEKDIFWRLTRRKVVYDELLLPKFWPELRAELTFRRRRNHSTERQKQYASTAMLYQQLRRRYRSDSSSLEERDFYFGELQMERLALGLPRRWISLSFLYRLLSGYGRQEGLALGWLVFFVFLLFPLLYWLLDPTVHGHWWASPLSHSLRVATFLRETESAANAVPAPLRTTLIEGFERIVLTAQVGLFIIALKWRFDPNRYQSSR